MKKLTILFLGLVMGFTSYAQQSAQYSQYMFNGLYVNPAYAGYREALNINAYYRSQWTGMPGGPQTMAFAVDGLTNNDKMGLGLNIIHDKLGNERNLSLYVNYAYRLQVSDDPTKRLAFGLGLGFLNSGFDNSKVSTGDQEGINIPNTFLPDARFGVFYSSLTFFAGLGGDNLLSTLVFNNKNNSKGLTPVLQYYFTAGGIIPLSNDILFKPSTLVKSAERGDSRSLTADLNAALIFSERFTVGASYRSAIKNKNTLARDLPRPNSVIGLVEIVAKSNFRIGYSFDYSLSKMYNYTGGTHEISVGYTLDRQRQRIRTPRYF
jgi:type IX secretion system PorP/SprF family membrane protein